MPNAVAPARIEFILVYACPACGREALIRPRETAAPATCRHCRQVYQPFPLADAARDAMLAAYASHQPPAPATVRVAGLRGLCFVLAAHGQPLQFDALAEVDTLHASLTNGRANADVPFAMGRTLLLHGSLREVGRPGDFAFAVIEGPTRRAEAFLEFADPGPDLAALPRGSNVCVQGVCRGLMGSHHPLSMVFSDCRLVGLQGQLLPPGVQVADAAMDFPPNSPANPLDAHVIFQYPPAQAQGEQDRGPSTEDPE